MATLGNKRKLSAFNGDMQDENASNNLSQNTNTPRIIEAFIKQVSEGMEKMVNKRCLRSAARQRAGFQALCST